MSALLAQIADMRSLRQAWQRVREGGRTQGVDKINFRLFARDLNDNLADLNRLLIKGWYYPAPVRRIDIPKCNGKSREIGIFTVSDRIVQQAVLNAIEPLAEPHFLPTSYAYRRSQSVQKAAIHILNCRDKGFYWVARGDVAAFFDSLDHNLLMSRLENLIKDAAVIRLIHGWLQAGILARGVYERKRIGAVQGSVLSPLLSNVYLIDFDRAVYLAGNELVRFADDFVILCRKRSQADKALILAETELARVYLALNPSKCVITNFDIGFKFLGVNFNSQAQPSLPKRRRPMKVTLYITEQGACLKKIGKRFQVVKDKQKLLDVPAFKVGQVVIFGNVQVTTQAIAFLLTTDTDLVYLSNNGKYYGRLQSPDSKNPDLKHLQLHVTDDSKKALEFSRQFVWGKILNMRTLILRHYGNSDNRAVLTTAVDRLKNYALQTRTADTIAKVRGLEGIAAKDYFEVFPLLLKDPMGFAGRNRRPPRDPVNSMLSFGYVLLVYDLLAAVNIAGLNPYLGFLHFSKYGRPSIALDLMEEFRPIIVDSLVLSLVNKQILKSDDFTFNEESPAVYLTEEARRVYLAQYQKKVLTTVKYWRTKQKAGYRDLFYLQTRHMINCFQSKETYQPVLIK